MNDTTRRYQMAKAALRCDRTVLCGWTAPRPDSSLANLTSPMKSDHMGHHTS